MPTQVKAAQWIPLEPGQVNVDRSNPLADGLFSAAITGPTRSFYDVALKQFFAESHPTDGSYNVAGIDTYGRWRRNDIGGASRQTVGNIAIDWPLVPVTGCVTQLLLIRPKTANTTNKIVLSAGEFNSGWLIANISMGNGTAQRFMGSAVDGSAAQVSADADYVVDQTYVVAYRSNMNTGSQNLFIDGNKQSGSAAYTAAASKGASAVQLAPLSAANVCDVYLALHWNRALSDAEIADISDNPYQVFKRIYRVNSDVNAVAGAITLTATADTQAGSSSTGAASASGRLTTLPLKNNTGTVQASATGITAYVYQTSGALVATKTGLSANGSGVVTFLDTALTPGTTYRVVIVMSNAAEGLDKLVAT